VNVERGIRRLVLVLSALILAVGLAGLAVEAETIAFVVVAAGTLFTGFWITFCAFRWVVRGFLTAPEPERRARDGSRWKTMLGLSIIAVLGGVLLFISAASVVWLWRALTEIRDGEATWHVVIARFLVSPPVVRLWRTVGAPADDDQGQRYCPVGRQLYCEWTRTR